MSDSVYARRAGRNDLWAVAELHNRCRPNAAPMEERDVLLSCVDTGYLIAFQDDHVCGAIAWRAENLIARVLDAYLEGNANQLAAEELLRLLDTQARELRCEVVLLADTESTRVLANVARSRGFEEPGDARLPPAWKEAAAELLADDRALLLKRLSNRRVRGPL